MKKVRNLSIKILACFLSALMLISVVPMTAFATDFKNHQTLNNIETVPEENFTIEKEIIEKRTENSKTYLLEDGTYCELVSAEPIHTYSYGEWEDVITIEQPATINAATEQIASAQATSAQVRGNVDDGYVVEDSSKGNFLWQINDTGEVTSNVATISQSSIAVIKCNIPKKDIYPKTESTISASIQLECNHVLTENSVAISPIYTTWAGETPTLADIEMELENPIIDYNTFANSGRQLWDITSEYLKWENGLTSNNGMLLLYDRTPVTLRNPILKRHYRIIDDNDSGFTYHNVDMGRAGTLYINDYTNIPYLERNELSVDGNILPVFLSRFITGLDNDSFGAGGRWNYESSLAKSADTFIWNLFNGSSARFQRANNTSDPNIVMNDNEGREKWVEYTYNKQGYTLWVDVDATREGNYSNNRITDDAGNIYTFTYYGKLSSVISANNASDTLQINYEGETIQSIVDGMGRKYKFTYDFINNFDVVSKVGVYTSSTNAAGESVDLPIQIVTAQTDSQGNPVSKNLEIVYQNQIIHNRICLTKATYADGKSVEYSYDDLGRLKSIKNIDGSLLELSYAVSAIDIGNDTLPVKALRISSYAKKNLDKNGTYVVDFNVNIESPSTYHKIFKQTNNQGTEVFSETIQFNRNLDLLYKTDSIGNQYFADYDDSHNLISLIISPEVSENIVTNSELDNGFGFKCPKNWRRGPNLGNNDVLVQSDKTGNYYVHYKNSSVKSIYIEQEITSYQGLDGTTKQFSGKAGDKYVLSAWGKGTATLPKENHFWEIRILAETTDGELKQIHQMTFDTSLWDVAQTRYTAFALPFDTTKIRIQLLSNHQLGEVNFDKVYLYKADDVYVATVDDTSEPSSPNPAQDMEPANDIHGNPTITGKKTACEKIFSQDSYSEDGQYLLSHTDENKVQTSYEYTISNGLLNSKTVANDTKINYGYDAMGALISVSQTVTNALNAEPVKMQTDYAYENDRISSITHNGFSYNYTYDVYGNVNSISVNDSPLVNYSYKDDYGRNIDTITYANGFEIHYMYDMKGNILSIAYNENTTPTYEYTYDVYGEVSTCIDHRNNTVTSFKKDIDGVQYQEVMQDLVTGNILYGITESQNGAYTKSLFGKNYTIKPIINYDIDGMKHTEQTIDTMVFSEPGSIKNYNTRDEFERLKTDAMDVYTSSGNIQDLTDTTLTVKNEYTYKTSAADASGLARTTNLIDTFASSVILHGKTKGADYEKVYESHAYKYDYDVAGRIIKVYMKNVNSLMEYTPVIAYEYDDAGQLIMEINSLVGSVCTYAYDAGGNRIEKNTYGNADVLETLDVVNLGVPTETVSYGYDSAWKDKLVSYNGKDLQYDELGNPLSYIGTNMSSEPVEMNLEWEGRFLKAASSLDGSSRYEYTYNENALRTSKRIFSKKTLTKAETDSSTGTITNVQVEQLVLQGEMEYYWSGDTLMGYRYTPFEVVTDKDNHAQFDQGGNVILRPSSSVEITPLYNEQNEILGVNAIGVQDGKTQSYEFYFVKDGQGNIISICSNDGTYQIDFAYDAFGNVSLNMTGKQIDDLNAMIQNANSTFEKIMASIGASIAIAALVSVTFTCVQSSYRSYLFDAETGLYYCQSRYYSPAWGRFINLDDTGILEVTKGEPLGANLFAYCNNDPVNYIDMNGYYYISLRDLSRVFLAIGMNPIGATLIYVGIARLSAMLKVKFSLFVARISWFWGTAIKWIFRTAALAVGLPLMHQLATAVIDCLLQGRRGIEFGLKRTRRGVPYGFNIYAR